MKLLVFSLILIASSPLWAKCQLKAPLYSLSGPVTVVLKELHLLQDKNLKGISTFNPIGADDYQGARLGGGLFLSRREDKVFGEHDVIYDHGRELDRYFKGRPYPSVSIDTMGLTPREVLDKVLVTLAPKLTGCESEVTALKNKKFESAFKTKKKIVFFLGSIRSGPRYPETVYGQDGFVLALTKSNQIQTYPSPLHYVRWSQKIINSLDKDFIFIGISEPKDQKEISLKKIDERHLNIIFPGALTPGLSQLELTNYLVKNL